MKTKKTMKKKIFTKKQVLVLAWVVSVGFLFTSPMVAKGFDLGGLFKINIGKEKDNQGVNLVTSFYNELGNLFGVNIQDYTNIAQTAIREIQGLQGQFSPVDAKKAIDQMVEPNNPLALNTNMGGAALATNDMATQQVLSKEGQKKIAAINEEMEALDQSTIALSRDSFEVAQAVEGYSSSQDVLKAISWQLSGQAEIASIQSRLSVIQNASAQNLLMNTAALNQASVSQLEKQMGENQAKKIEEMNSSASFISAGWQKMLIPTQ